MDIQHSKLLFSRIEDQLLDKFNTTFPDIENEKDVPDDVMIKMVVSWFEFWLSEKPVSKNGNLNQVLRMKEHICKIRITLLKKNIQTLDIYDGLPKYIKKLNIA